MKVVAFFRKPQWCSLQEKKKFKRQHDPADTHLGSIALQHHVYAREFQDMYVGSEISKKLPTFATELVRYLDSLILVHLQTSKPSGSFRHNAKKAKYDKIGN